MNSNIIAFAGVGTLIGLIIVIGFVVAKPVLAQVEATYTDPAIATSTPVEVIQPVSASTTQDVAPIAPTTEANPVSVPAETQVADAPQQIATQLEPTEPAPEGLTEVHIIGMKYIDYFTDGTNVVSFEGDPEIGAHLDEANATIPTREGLTWVHTVGRLLYDTSSGDLEVGQYALQLNGKYVVNPLPFISSTSTTAAIDLDVATSS